MNHLGENIFFPVVDQAISSLTTRFEQYESFQKNFGFLFTSDALKSLDEKSLNILVVFLRLH